MTRLLLGLAPVAFAMILGCSSGGGSETRGPGGAPANDEPISQVALGETRSGEGTYYDADGGGACLFDPSPDDLLVAALNAPDWAGSAWCGACADVDGPEGSVRVRIVDLCPECQPGDLDFSPEAFSRLAPLEQGRIPISWHFTACDVTGAVRYRYKDGANQWWTAVQVQNSRLPVTTLEWSRDGAAYQPTERTDYNYFLDATGFGPDPVRVRITAIDGQVLEDELPPVMELLVVDGSAQFR